MPEGLASDSVSALRSIRFEPGQTVDLTLRVAVSPGAVPGEGYRYEVAQYDGRRRAMGGVVLQVNVCG